MNNKGILHYRPALWRHSQTGLRPSRWDSVTSNGWCRTCSFASSICGLASKLLSCQSSTNARSVGEHPVNMERHSSSPVSNPLSYLFVARAFSFSPRHPSSQSCINEYVFSYKISTQSKIQTAKGQGNEESNSSSAVNNLALQDIC